MLPALFSIVLLFTLLLLLLPLLSLLLLLSPAVAAARAPPCTGGRSGDSSAYGMFSPPSVNGRCVRPSWYFWCNEWRRLPASTTTGIVAEQQLLLSSPSLSSALSRSESIDELRSERSLLSSAIVTVFSDIEPLSANALSLESSSDERFSTSDAPSSLLWLPLVWCRLL
uniref:Putative secreted peptide n=1 Tax=Anopheles braziliensis TaxID=58242 RepID=A0A2M3ZQG1_9DIPT